MPGRSPSKRLDRRARPFRPIALAAAGAISASVLFAAAAGASATARPDGGPSRPTPPRRAVALAPLLARAHAALARERSVRLLGQLSELDRGVGVYVAIDVEAGLNEGTLSETIASRGRRVTLGALVIPGRGFCTGAPDALTASCAMSAAQAWGAVGHWVSFGPSTAAYLVVRASVLFSDETAGLVPAPGAAGFSLTATRSYAGRSVLELRGPASTATGFPAGTVETLDLAATGSPLPVAARFSDPGRVVSSEWFSGWNQPFTVHPPAHPLPASSLG